MALPDPQAYNEAVQNPRLAFSDPDLQNGRPELNHLGIPRARSGNFACVYKMQNGGQHWAAKCFTTEVSDQQRRYEAISNYLAKVALPYTVSFNYLPVGIRVQGRSYPLLKMQWVQGEMLNAFVGRCIGYPETLLSVAKVWARMMADLKAANIAHGDLSHGNVLVIGDQIRLVDYDGMFVPALAGKQSNECGNRNYQLPTRTGWDFGPYLDNFSAWVIYVSLVALAVHPELWNAHRGGDECLIFRKEDFVSPESSRLLRDLAASPNTQLRFLVELFASLFNLSPQDVPALDGNLTIVAPTGRAVIPAGQNWWSDHLQSVTQPEEATGEENQQVEIEAVVSDPGWIVDSLTREKIVERLPFKRSPKEERIIIAGSLALVILTKLLIAIPAAQFSVIAGFVFGLNVLVCFIRYKRDPSFAEFETFKNQAKAFVRQIQEHQTVMDAISAERAQIQESLAATERQLSEQKSRLMARLKADLASAQAALDSQLKTVNQRRREASTSETQKLNAIQGTLGNQISSIDRKVAELIQKEADEKANFLKAIQDNHVRNYLSEHSVHGSWIPNVGPTYKSRLVLYGFRTAADINWTVRNVPGIGPRRETALLGWRSWLAQEAHKSAPGMAAQDRLTIENKYQNQRQSLTSEKQRLESQFNAQVTSVRQHFTNLRQSLSEEEQQARSSCTRNKGQIQQAHDSEIRTLDQKINAVRNQTSPIVTELSRKLQNAQKHIFNLRWQSAKHESDGRRFASLRFRDYLRRIVRV